MRLLFLGAPLPPEGCLRLGGVSGFNYMDKYALLWVCCGDALWCGPLGGGILHGFSRVESEQYLPNVCVVIGF